MAHERNWLTSRSHHTTNSAVSGELRCAREVERLLQELREGREAPEFDAETAARLHELLGCGPRR